MYHMQDGKFTKLCGLIPAPEGISCTNCKYCFRMVTFQMEWTWKEGLKYPQYKKHLYLCLTCLKWYQTLYNYVDHLHPNWTGANIANCNPVLDLPWAQWWRFNYLQSVQPSSTHVNSEENIDEDPYFIPDLREPHDDDGDWTAWM